MDVTQEVQVDRLEVKTSLSSEALVVLEAKLPPIGTIGEESLKIARIFAQALENIQGATGDLRLIAIKAASGKLSFSLTLEASSFSAPSESSAAALPNRGAGTKFDDLELSTRARQTIIRMMRPLSVSDITAADIAKNSIDELQNERGCGPKTVAEIREKLGALGLKMQGDN
jgi:DNA-directed RNA polymerase alpha subunit